MNSEMYIFILWKHARSKEQEILMDIRNSFMLLKEYEVIWTPALATSNFSRFFGKRITENDVNMLYGNGSFVVCVISATDANSVLEKQRKYQKLCNNKEAVYASSSFQQTNRDITLLLGKCAFDLKTDYDFRRAGRMTVVRDLEGTNCWKDLCHLF